MPSSIIAFKASKSYEISILIASDDKNGKMYV
nr:MAG TPA: hypothetical protein [Caudoviricetes sp.]